MRRFELVAVVLGLGCGHAPSLPKEPACVQVGSTVGMCIEVYRDGGLTSHSCDQTLCDQCFKSQPFGQSYYDSAEYCYAACR